MTSYKQVINSLTEKKETDRILMSSYEQVIDILKIAAENAQDMEHRLDGDIEYIDFIDFVCKELKGIRDNLYERIKEEDEEYLGENKENL